MIHVDFLTAAKALETNMTPSETKQNQNKLRKLHDPLATKELASEEPTDRHKENGVQKTDYLGMLPSEIGTDYNFKRQIVWKNAIGFLILHLMAVYGLYLTTKASVYTSMWMVFVGIVSGIGVTVGAHRCFSHKAFKATAGTRLVLILLHTLAGQNCLYVWCRDHRQHHKYSDTDADPHNAHRGFFFSHIGWLMSKKHPAVISKGKAIDLSDLAVDPIVMWQKQHYKVLYTIFAIIFPTFVPVLCWDENIYNSFFIAYMLRNILILNVTWSVNSAAHIFGNKPFDKYMKPVESKFVAFVSVGEGWHNYHHAFPWDYRAAEFGSKYSLTTFVIDVMAFLGLVYDLRTTPYHMVEKRAKRTGDGSHPLFGAAAEKLENTGSLEGEDIKGIIKDSEYLSQTEKQRWLESDLNQRLVTAQG